MEHQQCLSQQYHLIFCLWKGELTLPVGKPFPRDRNLKERAEVNSGSSSNIKQFPLIIQLPQTELELSAATELSIFCS